jgi:condensin complex subunit 1
LRAVATLSFSKFLCVSSQFCDANHHLLFRILKTSRDANIRSNIAIALGDVAVSFGTIVDENSDELYCGLSDGDLVVKKNTLMVLTHLILNGMIKVKGQLGEMAKCLEDSDERIADLAMLFFTDLSTKDNAIYNNLPDGKCFLFRVCMSPRVLGLIRRAQSLAISPLANTRWTKKDSNARCATFSHSSKR